MVGDVQNSVFSQKLFFWRCSSVDKIDISRIAALYKCANFTFSEANSERFHHFRQPSFWFFWITLIRCSENFFSWQPLPGSMLVSEVHQDYFLTKLQILMVMINFLHVFHVISLSLLSLSSSELPHLIMSMTNHRNMIVPFIISYFASSISCGISNLKGAKGFYY